MTSVLIVDGKEFVPATNAGKHFGYTKDYLLLLIKEGKIEGKKIGNKWYVHMSTAEVYFRNAEKNREERRKTISEVRKEELKQHTYARQKTHHRTAVLETLVIVIIGLSLGATGYLGTTSTVAIVHESMGSSNVVERLAISLYNFISPSSQVVVPVSEPVSDSVEEQQSGFIVAPEEFFTANSIESIENSFSDPVEVFVDEENENTGIITPIFKNSESEAYRFLMVPVTPTP